MEIIPDQGLWASSSLTTNLTIYDANLGLEMTVHASLKL